MKTSPQATNKLFTPNYKNYTESKKKKTHTIPRITEQ